MADKTLGIKVTEEVYEKAQATIAMSGLTAKEWFEKAVSLYEMNSIKQGSSDYTQDLTELEHHTTRIYDLVVNMIQRSIYLKDHAVKEITEKLDSKDSIISEFQMQVVQLKEDVAKISFKLETIRELLKKRIAAIDTQEGRAHETTTRS